jgi:hypothetical protein
MALQGVPEGFNLAVPGRRLVAQAEVRRLFVGDLASSGLGGLSSESSRSSVSSLSSSSSPWDPLFTSSSRRASAFSSISSVSSCGPPSRTSSVRVTPSRSVEVRRTPSAVSIEPRPLTPSRAKRPREDSLVLLVFNDLVMTVEQDKGKMFAKPRQNRWRVSHPSEGGVCRILEAKDWSGCGGEQGAKEGELTDQDTRAFLR